MCTLQKKFEMENVLHFECVPREDSNQSVHFYSLFLAFTGQLRVECFYAAMKILIMLH